MCSSRQKIVSGHPPDNCPCKFPPGQLPPPPPLPPGQLPPPPRQSAPDNRSPRTFTPGPFPPPPDNCLPANSTVQLLSPHHGQFPHLTRNFFCFCCGTRSLSSSSVRPWVHLKGRVQLELD